MSFDITIYDANGQVKVSLASIPIITPAKGGTGQDFSAASGLIQLSSGTASATTTPTISAFTNANHDHSNSSNGGQLNATTAFGSGTIPSARLPVDDTLIYLSIWGN